MEIISQEIKQLRHRYEIRVPKDHLEKQIQDRLHSLRIQAKVPGFRTGKVPLSLIQKRYQTKVTQDIVHETIVECTQKLIQEQNLNPAQDPQIITSSKNLTGDLTFAIELEVLPEIKIPDFRSITLERLRCEPTQALIDTGLNQLAQSRRQAHKIQTPRPTQPGDLLIIDYTISHPTIQTKEGQDVQIRLGDDTLNLGPIFEEQVTNLEIGQTKTIEITLPQEEYFGEYAGESIHLSLIVKEICELPEVVIDDEFARQFQTESLEQLRDQIRAQYAREIAHLSYINLKTQLFDYLEQNYMCPLPEKLIQKELGLMWTTYQKQSDLETITEEQFHQDYRTLAERRLFLAFLISEAGKQRNIQISDEEISQTLLYYIREQKHEDPEALFNRLKDKPEIIQQIAAPLLENKVVDAIFGEVTILDKPIQVEELYEKSLP